MTKEMQILKEGKLTTEMLSTINHRANVDFGSARDMLMGVNMVLKAKFFMSSGRVSYRDEEGKLNDAYATSYYEEFIKEKGVNNSVQC